MNNLVRLETISSVGSTITDSSMLIDALSRACYRSSLRFGLLCGTHTCGYVAFIILRRSQRDTQAAIGYRDVGSRLDKRDRN